MSVLENPLYRPLLEVLRLSRNGIVYGGKIRFSHALVINLLYRKGPLLPRLKSVLSATHDHAKVLASFAIVYKIVQKLLLREEFLGSNSQSQASLLAGAIGGWMVYSNRYPQLFSLGITHQITLYCFSRVVIALGKVIVDYYLHCRQPQFHLARTGSPISYSDLSMVQKKRVKNSIYNRLWKYFAVLVWALVMFLNDYSPEYLQSSLRHSMTYIYDVEQDSWPTWRLFLGV